MFEQKYTVELVCLDEEINVVGLSFKKCRQSGSVRFDSPMELYGRESFELQDHINHVKLPQTGYGVWARAAEDVIVGKGVSSLEDQDELYGSFVIPAGRYLKITYNAENFDLLVNDAQQNAWQRSGADDFLAARRLEADHLLDIEVYPHETALVGQEGGPAWGPKYLRASLTAPVVPYCEMHSLFSVKEK